MLRAEDKGLANGYAEALYALAAAQKAEDKLQEDLFAFRKAMESSHELKDFMANRTLPPAVKKAALDDLLDPAAGEAFRTILAAMVENGRAHLAGDGMRVPDGVGAHAGSSGSSGRSAGGRPGNCSGTWSKCGSRPSARKRATIASSRKKVASLVWK